MTTLINGIPVEFITRRGMKNVRVRVDRNAKVTVSAPEGYPLEKARRFALEKFDWIAKNVEKARKKPSPDIRDGAVLPVLGENKKFVFVIGTRKKVALSGDEIVVTASEKSLLSAAEKYLSERLTEYLRERINYYQRLTGLLCSRFSVGKMRSRWGVCYTETKALKFSLALVFQPLENIDYVVLHELAHLYRAAHDKTFYAFIARFMPDYKSRMKF